MDPYNITVFIKYAEMEMKNKHVNMARNIWDRAVTIQPRVDQFWYKFAYMEETIGNIEGAREVYERWMRWEPEEAIWQSYIKFEKRYKQWGRMRLLFERLVNLHPITSAFLQWAKFEEDGRHFEEARAVFERALDTIKQREPRLFVEFARFEVRRGEFERARQIYRIALDLFPKTEAEGLYNSYAHFERQYGDEDSMQQVIIMKRRTLYEERIRENPHDYDSWFDYIRLEEEGGDTDIIREVYERAIANTPPAAEKRLWRRYIYFWIYYAVYEELTMQDVNRARAIYKAALEMVPHRQFTFAKLWNLYARFQLRQGDLSAARKTFGMALGLAAKPKIFKDYIEMEVQLREFDRCRLLYEKFLEYDPSNATTWLKYAELERGLGDDDRAHALYELAISQPIDMPELLWKAYIDYEYELERVDAARQLYERLLTRTEHLKVWVSFANFEASLPTADAMPRARSILQRAYDSLAGLTTERILLLEAWKELEIRADPASTQLTELLAKFPRAIQRQRETEEGVEEYTEWVFPEDEPKRPATKLLEMAHKWKQANQSVTSE